MSAYAIVSKKAGAAIFSQIPVYDCMKFENITGRRPFRYVPRDKFEEKLGNAKCVDLESV